MTTTTIPSIPHILLLGGHGKVSLLLTPLLLARAWHVTSLIRDAAQREDVLAAGRAESSSRGKLDVLVESLEDVKSENDARGILQRVGAQWVVWSAGKGSFS